MLIISVMLCTGGVIDRGLVFDDHEGKNLRNDQKTN